MKSAGKVIAATLLFWAIILLGPFLIVLWNAISLVRYEEGTLGFTFFATIVQALAALIAWYAASYIFDGACRKTTAVNCIIGAVLFIPLTFVSAASWQEVISNAATVLALIAGVVYCFTKKDG